MPQLTKAKHVTNCCTPSFWGTELVKKEAAHMDVKNYLNSHSIFDSHQKHWKAGLGHQGSEFLLLLTLKESIINLINLYSSMKKKKAMVMFYILTWTDKQGINITKLSGATTGYHCLVYT